jgi:serine/threonine protein kinase
LYSVYNIESRSLSLRIVWYIIEYIQVFSGVAWLHGLLIMHRDVKPSNILIYSSPTSPQRAILTDFGWSKTLNSTEDSVPGGLGGHDLPAQLEEGATPGCVSFPYRAPELFLKLPYGAGVDVWAAGVVFRELITGRLMVRAMDKAKLSGKLSGPEPGLTVCAALGGKICEKTMPGVTESATWVKDVEADPLLPFIDNLLPPSWMGLRGLSDQALTLNPKLRPQATHIVERLAGFMCRVQPACSVSGHV